MSCGSGPHVDQAGDERSSCPLLVHVRNGGCVKLFQGTRNPQDTSEDEGFLCGCTVKCTQPGSHLGSHMATPQGKMRCLLLCSGYSPGLEAQPIVGHHHFHDAASTMLLLLSLLPLPSLLVSFGIKPTKTGLSPCIETLYRRNSCARPTHRLHAWN